MIDERLARAMAYFKDKAGTTDVDADRQWMAEAVMDAHRVDPNVHHSSDDSASTSSSDLGGVFGGTGLGAREDVKTAASRGSRKSSGKGRSARRRKRRAPPLPLIDDREEEEGETSSPPPPSSEPGFSLCVPLPEIDDNDSPIAEKANIRRQMHAGIGGGGSSRQWQGGGATLGGRA